MINNNKLFKILVN